MTGRRRQFGDPDRHHLGPDPLRTAVARARQRTATAMSGRVAVCTADQVPARDQAAGSNPAEPRCHARTKPRSRVSPLRMGLAPAVASSDPTLANLPGNLTHAMTAIRRVKLADLARLFRAGLTGMMSPSLIQAYAVIRVSHDRSSVTSVRDENASSADPSDRSLIGDVLAGRCAQPSSPPPASPIDAAYRLGSHPILIIGNSKPWSERSGVGSHGAQGAGAAEKLLPRLVCETAFSIPHIDTERVKAVLPRRPPDAANPAISPC